MIAVSVLLAWANSYSAPFEMDDHGSILNNASIRDLSSFRWLVPPATAGETVSGRPVLNLSFAVNHALGRLNVRGYRVVNVGIHLISSLVLFGLVRRTLAPFKVAGRIGSTGSDCRAGMFFALAVALIWAVHPLQTAAVTYVVQRAESLAGLFYLLTLYCFVRTVEKEAAGWRWPAATVGACLLGMATKETMVTAPLVVLLYDRAFAAGSLRAAWTARWRLYLGLAATWLLLAGLVLINLGRGGSVGFDADIGAWTYLLTQCDAITRYLQLVFWPDSQVFDYGVATATGLAEVLPQFLFLCVLAAGAGWALWRNRASGFLGASFFLLLAPSSSIVPVTTQTIAEHRMYLALSVPVVIFFFAIGAARKGRMVWLAGVILVLLTIILGRATYARNQVYGSELTLWQDTVAKRPENPRAHNNLGSALMTAGRFDDAMAAFRRTIELQPNHAIAHSNLAAVLLTKKQWEEAIGHLRAALAADPAYVSARVNLGKALAELGRVDEAIAENEAVLVLDPGAQDARTNLAGLLIRRGQAGEAMEILHEVLLAEPKLAEAHWYLGRALEMTGQMRDAAIEFQEAIRLKPGWAVPHLAMGNLLLRQGDAAGAERNFSGAVDIDSKSVEASYGWGNALAQQQKFDGAIKAYRLALAIDPTHVEARNNLGNCHLVQGRYQEAITTYELVLQLHPDESTARKNIELARELLRGH